MLPTDIFTPTTVLSRSINNLVVTENPSQSNEASGPSTELQGGLDRNDPPNLPTTIAPSEVTIPPTTENFNLINVIEATKPGELPSHGAEGEPEHWAKMMEAMIQKDAEIERLKMEKSQLDCVAQYIRIKAKYGGSSSTNNTPTPSTGQPTNFNAAPAIIYTQADRDRIIRDKKRDEMMETERKIAEQEYRALREYRAKFPEEFQSEIFKGNPPAKHPLAPEINYILDPINNSAPDTIVVYIVPVGYPNTIFTLSLRDQVSKAISSALGELAESVDNKLQSGTLMITAESIKTVRLLLETIKKGLWRDDDESVTFEVAGPMFNPAPTLDVITRSRTTKWEDLESALRNKMGFNTTTWRYLGQRNIGQGSIGHLIIIDIDSAKRIGFQRLKIETSKWDKTASGTISRSWALKCEHPNKLINLLITTFELSSQFKYPMVKEICKPELMKTSNSTTASLPYAYNGINWPLRLVFLMKTKSRCKTGSGLNKLTSTYLKYSIHTHNHENSKTIELVFRYEEFYNELNNKKTELGDEKLSFTETSKKQNWECSLNENELRDVIEENTGKLKPVLKSDDYIEGGKARILSQSLCISELTSKQKPLTDKQINDTHLTINKKLISKRQENKSRLINNPQTSYLHKTLSLKWKNGGKHRGRIKVWANQSR